MPDRADGMTLDECRHFIARDEGWKQTTQRPPDCYEAERMVWARGKSYLLHHPVGSDLTSIAGAMPEGWWLTTIEFGDISGVRAVAIKRPPLPVGTHVEMTAPTELLARARLAVLCRMAGKGEGA